MTRLVGQLLSLARLDAAPSRVTGPLDLRTVAAEVVAGLAPLAVRQGKEVALVGEDAVTIPGEAAAIGEAVSNLVENAIRHTAPGTCVEVTVEIPGRVRVADRGPGVPEAERAGLFERFRQGGGMPGGAGLGLAIAAEVARLHQGAVTIEDRPDGGAVFTLELAAADGSSGRGQAGDATMAAVAGEG